MVSHSLGLRVAITCHRKELWLRTFQCESHRSLRLERAALQGRGIQLKPLLHNNLK